MTSDATQAAIISVKDMIRDSANQLTQAANQIQSEAKVDAGRVRTIAESLNLLADRLEDHLPTTPIETRGGDPR